MADHAFVPGASVPPTSTTGAQPGDLSVPDGLRLPPSSRHPIASARNTLGPRSRFEEVSLSSSAWDHPRKPRLPSLQHTTRRRRSATQGTPPVSPPASPAESTPASLPTVPLGSPSAAAASHGAASSLERVMPSPSQRAVTAGKGRALRPKQAGSSGQESDAKSDSSLVRTHQLGPGDLAGVATIATTPETKLKRGTPKLPSRRAMVTVVVPPDACEGGKRLSRLRWFSYEAPLDASASASPSGRPAASAPPRPPSPWAASVALLLAVCVAACAEDTRLAVLPAVPDAAATAAHAVALAVLTVALFREVGRSGHVRRRQPGAGGFAVQTDGACLSSPWRVAEIGAVVLGWAAFPPVFRAAGAAPSTATALRALSKLVLIFLHAPIGSAAAAFAGACAVRASGRRAPAPEPASVRPRTPEARSPGVQTAPAPARAVQGPQSHVLPGAGKRGPVAARASAYAVPSPAGSLHHTATGRDAAADRASLLDSVSVVSSQWAGREVVVVTGDRPGGPTGDGKPGVVSDGHREEKNALESGDPEGTWISGKASPVLSRKHLSGSMLARPSDLPAYDNALAPRHSFRRQQTMPAASPQHAGAPVLPARVPGPPTMLTATTRSGTSDEANDSAEITRRLPAARVAAAAAPHRGALGTAGPASRHSGHGEAASAGAREDEDDLSVVDLPDTTAVADSLARGAGASAAGDLEAMSVASSAREGGGGGAWASRLSDAQPIPAGASLAGRRVSGGSSSPAPARGLAEAAGARPPRATRGVRSPTPQFRRGGDRVDSRTLFEGHSFSGDSVTNRTGTVESSNQTQTRTHTHTHTHTRTHTSSTSSTPATHTAGSDAGAGMHRLTRGDAGRPAPASPPALSPRRDEASDGAPPPDAVGSAGAHRSSSVVPPAPACAPEAADRPLPLSPAAVATIARPASRKFSTRFRSALAFVVAAAIVAVFALDGAPEEERAEVANAASEYLFALHRMPQDRNVSESVFKAAVVDAALALDLRFISICPPASQCANTWPDATLAGWVSSTVGGTALSPSAAAASADIGSSDAVVSVTLGACFSAGVATGADAGCPAALVASVAHPLQRGAVRRLVAVAAATALVVLAAGALAWRPAHDALADVDRAKHALSAARGVVATQSGRVGKDSPSAWRRDGVMPTVWDFSPHPDPGDGGAAAGALGLAAPTRPAAVAGDDDAASASTSVWTPAAEVAIASASRPRRARPAAPVSGADAGGRGSGGVAAKGVSGSASGATYAAAWAQRREKLTAVPSSASLDDRGSQSRSRSRSRSGRSRSRSRSGRSRSPGTGRAAARRRKGRHRRRRSRRSGRPASSSDSGASQAQRSPGADTPTHRRRSRRHRHRSRRRRENASHSQSASQEHGRASARLSSSGATPGLPPPVELQTATADGIERAASRTSFSQFSTVGSRSPTLSAAAAAATAGAAAAPAVPLITTDASAMRRAMRRVEHEGGIAPPGSLLSRASVISHPGPDASHASSVDGVQISRRTSGTTDAGARAGERPMSSRGEVLGDAAALRRAGRDGDRARRGYLYTSNDTVSAVPMRDTSTRESAGSPGSPAFADAGDNDEESVHDSTGSRPPPSRRGAPRPAPRAGSRSGKVPALLRPRTRAGSGHRRASVAGQSPHAKLSPLAVRTERSASVDSGRLLAARSSRPSRDSAAAGLAAAAAVAESGAEDAQRRRLSSSHGRRESTSSRGRPRKGSGAPSGLVGSGLSGSGFGAYGDAAAEMQRAKGQGRATRQTRDLALFMNSFEQLTAIQQVTATEGLGAAEVHSAVASSATGAQAAPLTSRTSVAAGSVISGAGVAHRDRSHRRAARMAGRRPAEMFAAVLEAMLEQGMVTREGAPADTSQWEPRCLRRTRRRAGSRRGQGAESAETVSKILAELAARARAHRELGRGAGQAAEQEPVSKPPGTGATSPPVVTRSRAQSLARSAGRGGSDVASHGAHGGVGAGAGSAEASDAALRRLSTGGVPRLERALAGASPLARRADTTPLAVRATSAGSGGATPGASRDETASPPKGTASASAGRSNPTPGSASARDSARLAGAPSRATARSTLGSGSSGSGGVGTGRVMSGGLGVGGREASAVHAESGTEWGGASDHLANARNLSGSADGSLLQFVPTQNRLPWPGSQSAHLSAPSPPTLASTHSSGDRVTDTATRVRIHVGGASPAGADPGGAADARTATADTDGSSRDTLAAGALSAPSMEADAADGGSSPGQWDPSTSRAPSLLASHLAAHAVPAASANTGLSESSSVSSASFRGPATPGSGGGRRRVSLAPGAQPGGGLGSQMGFSRRGARSRRAFPSGGSSGAEEAGSDGGSEAPEPGSPGTAQAPAGAEAVDGKRAAAVAHMVDAVEAGRESPDRDEGSSTPLRSRRRGSTSLTEVAESEMETERGAGSRPESSTNSRRKFTFSGQRSLRNTGGGTDAGTLSRSATRTAGSTTSLSKRGSESFRSGSVVTDSGPRSLASGVVDTAQKAGGSPSGLHVGRPDQAPEPLAAGGVPRSSQGPFAAPRPSIAPDPHPTDPAASRSGSLEVPGYLFQQAEVSMSTTTHTQSEFSSPRSGDFHSERAASRDTVMETPREDDAAPQGDIPAIPASSPDGPQRNSAGNNRPEEARTQSKPASDTESQNSVSSALDGTRQLPETSAGPASNPRILSFPQKDKPNTSFLGSVRRMVSSVFKLSKRTQREPTTPTQTPVVNAETRESPSPTGLAVSRTDADLRPAGASTPLESEDDGSSNDASASAYLPLVMISYKHKEKDIALRVTDMIRSTGRFRVWIDTQIVPGENWRAAIAAAIQESVGVVFVMSKASLKSKYCHEELMFASSTKTKIFPIVVEKDAFDALTGGLKLLLSPIQCTDLVEDFEGGAQKMIKQLDVEYERLCSINENEAAMSRADQEVAYSSSGIGGGGGGVRGGSYAGGAGSVVSRADTVLTHKDTTARFIPLKTVSYRKLERNVRVSEIYIITALADVGLARLVRDKLRKRTGMSIGFNDQMEVLLRETKREERRRQQERGGRASGRDGPLRSRGNSHADSGDDCRTPTPVQRSRSDVSRQLLAVQRVDSHGSNTEPTQASRDSPNPRANVDSRGTDSPTVNESLSGTPSKHDRNHAPGSPARVAQLHALRQAGSSIPKEGMLVRAPTDGSLTQLDAAGASDVESESTKRRSNRGQGSSSSDADQTLPESSRYAPGMAARPRHQDRSLHDERAYLSEPEPSRRMLVARPPLGRARAHHASENVSEAGSAVRSLSRPLSPRTKVTLPGIEKYGDTYTSAAIKLKSAKVVLFLFTQSSIGLSACENEVQFAIGLNKQVIVLAAEGTDWRQVLPPVYIPANMLSRARDRDGAGTVFSTVSGLGRDLSVSRGGSQTVSGARASAASTRIDNESPDSTGSPRMRSSAGQVGSTGSPVSDIRRTLSGTPVRIAEGLRGNPKGDVHTDDPSLLDRGEGDDNDDGGNDGQEEGEARGSTESAEMKHIADTLALAGARAGKWNESQTDPQAGSSEDQGRRAPSLLFVKVKSKVGEGASTPSSSLSSMKEGSVTMGASHPPHGGVGASGSGVPAPLSSAERESRVLPPANSHDTNTFPSRMSVSLSSGDPGQRFHSALPSSVQRKDGMSVDRTYQSDGELESIAVANARDGVLLFPDQSRNGPVRSKMSAPVGLALVQCHFLRLDPSTFETCIIRLGSVCLQILAAETEPGSEGVPFRELMRGSRIDVAQINRDDHARSRSGISQGGSMMSAWTNRQPNTGPESELSQVSQDSGSMTRTNAVEVASPARPSSRANEPGGGQRLRVPARSPLPGLRSPVGVALKTVDPRLVPAVSSPQNSFMSQASGSQAGWPVAPALRGIIGAETANTRTLAAAALLARDPRAFDAMSEDANSIVHAGRRLQRRAQHHRGLPAGLQAEDARSFAESGLAASLDGTTERHESEEESDSDTAPKRVLSTVQEAIGFGGDADAEAESNSPDAVSEASRETPASKASS